MNWIKVKYLKYFLDYTISQVKTSKIFLCNIYHYKFSGPPMFVEHVKKVHIYATLLKKIYHVIIFLYKFRVAIQFNGGSYNTIS